MVMRYFVVGMLLVIVSCSASSESPDGSVKPSGGGGGFPSGSGGGAPSGSGGGVAGGTGGGSIAPGEMDASVRPPDDAGSQVADAGSAGDEEYRVAAAGDIVLTSSSASAAHRKTSDLLLKQDYDAVLLLGDNQYPDGTLSDYQKYYAPTWGRVKQKTYPSPGNHEYHTPNAAGYFEYFGNRTVDPVRGYYSFDLGNWHLISLNTNTDNCGIIACNAQSEQVKWLEADLKANTKKCVLAYWHHPRFNSGSSHGNFSGAQAFWDVLYKYKADIVLNGHEHTYERFAPQNPQAKAAADGIREFVVGTGGAGFYSFKSTPEPNSQVRENKTYGILQLTLKPSSYDWKFVPVEGQVFTDTGSTDCH
jgi:acid phosphatase type 7